MNSIHSLPTNSSGQQKCRLKKEKKDALSKNDLFPLLWYRSSVSGGNANHHHQQQHHLYKRTDKQTISLRLLIYISNISYGLCVSVCALEQCRRCTVLNL